MFKVKVPFQNAIMSQRPHGSAIRIGKTLNCKVMYLLWLFHKMSIMAHCLCHQISDKSI